MAKTENQKTNNNLVRMSLKLKNSQKSVSMMNLHGIYRHYSI